MIDEELQERVQQVIQAVLQDTDKRVIWELARQQVIDPLSEDRDAYRIVDLVHKARITVTFD